MTSRTCARTVVAVITLAPAAVLAQPAGTSTWQLAPFCNRVTVTTAESGGVYTLSGYDDLCGGGQRAPVVGVASPNPDGSFELGLTTILPDGRSRTAIATVAAPAWSGTWRGAGGRSGVFTLGGDGAGPGLDPSSAVAGGRTSTDGGARAGRGGGDPEPAAGAEPGDITAVIASFGLYGGGTSGDVALSVNYGADGSDFAVARADHEHDDLGGVSVGFGALSNAIAAVNVAVGTYAASATTSGHSNAALGNAALKDNTIGNDNTAAGSAALHDNTTGSSNTAVGSLALAANTSGSNNTALGYRADLNAGTLTNATAVGARSRVDQSNSLVLGSVRFANGAQSGVKVGIGTTTPDSLLDLVDDLSLGGDSLTATRAHDSAAAPVLTFRKSRGTVSAPAGVQSGDNLLFLRATGHNGTAMSATGRATLVAQASQAWAIGSEGARWTLSTTANGSTTTQERLRIDHDGNVGIGTTNPLARLHVAGGTVRLDSLGTAGTTALCRNASNQIATCSSSLRYKRDLGTFTGGLDLVARLRPITYTWSESGALDVGFGAEEVAAVDPRFVIYDDTGRSEGVKYDRLTVALVDAVKELAARNAALERRLQELEAAARGQQR